MELRTLGQDFRLGQDVTVLPVEIVARNIEENLAVPIRVDGLVLEGFAPQVGVRHHRQ